MSYTASEIAERVQGRVIGDPATSLTGFAPAGNAKPGDLTFAENEIYFARAEQSAAAAILVDETFESSKKVLIRVPNARVAFAKVLPLFFPEAAFPCGIHPSTVVAASAQIDPTAHIGPLCIVGDNARIGARAVLYGFDYVDANCQVGDDSHLFPNVTLYPRTQIGHRVRIHAGTVIGSDGFGYVLDGGIHRKVPQIGFVIIQDDVEKWGGEQIAGTSRNFGKMAVNLASIRQIQFQSQPLKETDELDAPNIDIWDLDD